METPAPTPAQPTDPTIGGAAPAQGAASVEGRRFGRYVVQALIGRGGMGAVYRAWDENLGRAVALKTLAATSEATREADLARFRREAQSAARLRHPNVVAVYDVGEADGLPFFTMELIDGVRLDHWMRGEGRAGGAKPTWVELARVLEKTSRALHCAHIEGIIHRDVKPSNVLVDSRDEPRLGDFGLARAVDVPAGSELTISGEILGTPAFMSPEQAFGELSRIGPRSDVFSLGSVLYHCLTGRDPFQESGLHALVLAITQEDPVPPTKLCPEVPRALEAICLTAMEKEPERRYQSALDLAEDLARFVAGVPVRARRPGVFSRIARGMVRHWKTLLAAALFVVCADIGWRTISRENAQSAFMRMTQERRARAQDLLDKLPPLRGMKDRAGLEALLPLLSEAVACDPTFGAASLRRGVVKQKLGDLDGALADFEEALRRDPSLAEAHYRLGFLLLARQDTLTPDAQIRARSEFLAAEKALPGSLFASLGEALIGILGDDWAAAHATLDRLAQAPERHPDVYLLRGALRSYRFQARGVKRKTVPPEWFDLEAAVADFDVAIELDPVSAWGHGARGLCRFDLGDLEGAREDLIASFLLDANSEVAYFVARVAYLQGDIAGAEEWATKTLECGGQSGVRRLRGYFYLMDGKYDRALAELDLIAREYRDEPETFALRAIVRYAKGDRAGAEEDIRQYASLSPALMAEIQKLDGPFAKNRQAVFFIETGLRDSERILFLPPERKKQMRDLQRTLGAFPWYEESMSKMRDGVRNSPDSLGFIISFSTLAEERPELSGASDFLAHGFGVQSGFLLGKEGRTLARLVEEEMLLWRKKLGNAKEYLRRGSARYRRGDDAGALVDLEEAARRAPGDADTLYALATLRAIARNKEGALAALSQAISAGWAHTEYTAKDPDFAPVAASEEFRRLVGQ